MAILNKVEWNVFSAGAYSKSHCLANITSITHGKFSLMRTLLSWLGVMINTKGALGFFLDWHNYSFVFLRYVHTLCTWGVMLLTSTLQPFTSFVLKHRAKYNRKESSLHILWLKYKKQKTSRRSHVIRKRQVAFLLLSERSTDCEGYVGYILYKRQATHVHQGFIRTAFVTQYRSHIQLTGPCYENRKTLP